ncbi:retrotransposon hot spot (RHS) protein [Trypanosoma cruzi]|nr:retrotransposon hot spot (RHS) protein [Trypanosoma cruzi]
MFIDNLSSIKVWSCIDCQLMYLNFFFSSNCVRDMRELLCRHYNLYLDKGLHSVGAGESDLRHHFFSFYKPTAQADKEEIVEALEYPHLVYRIHTHPPPTHTYLYAFTCFCCQGTQQTQPSPYDRIQRKEEGRKRE